MKKLTIIVGASLALLASSCTVIYPGVAVQNKIEKTGTVEAKTFLGIGNVDIGAQEAAKKGGINKIATVDYSVRYGLFITKYKVIVTGE